jgi:hypothetical protein
MLPEPEMKQLAESIKAHGLRNPIVVDPEQLILDGRNRWEGCKRAEVEPTTVLYEPKGKTDAERQKDIAQFILDVNVARRNLTTGQRAMATALVLAAVPGNRIKGRWKRGIVPADSDRKVTSDSWQTRMKEAGVIIDWADDLAEGVVGGSDTIGNAYSVACERREAKQEELDDFATLQDEMPAWAEQVTQGEISLEDAMNDLASAKRVREIDETVIGDGSPPFADRVGDSLSWSEAETLAERWLREYNESIERDASRIRNVNDGWKSTLEYLRGPDSQRSEAIRKQLADIDIQRLTEIGKELASE